MSIKKNYMFNLIRVGNQILFPLITIPYITRILGAKGIGFVEYLIALSSYGILVSNFGLSTSYSIEISKMRDNENKIIKTVKEAFSFQIISTLLGVILFVIISLTLKINEVLFVLMFLFKIFLNMFKVEWYFIGTENFKYITIRDFIVKVIFIVLTFTLVKKDSDLLKYALALILGDSLSSLFNLRRMLTELKISVLDLIEIKKENIYKVYRTTLPFLLAGLSVSIYSSLDKIMLGKISGSEYVGYYAMSNKLVRISMSIPLALATTITPRLAYSYFNKEQDFFQLIKRSTNFILMLIFPMCLGIFLLASDIILLVFGENFIQSTLTLKILSILLIIVPFANIFGLQILNVIGKANKYTSSLIIAASLNLLFNIILIPKFKNNGAAISTIVAEIIGVIVQLFYVIKVINVRRIFSKNIFKYIISTIIMGCIIVYLELNFKDYRFKLLIQIILGIITYFISLIILREELVLEAKKKLNNNFRRGK